MVLIGKMLNKPSILERTKNSKTLTVVVVWATLAVDMLLYAALVPILPKLVTSLSKKPEANLTEQPVKVQDINTTGTPSTVSCHEEAAEYDFKNNSLITIVGTILALKQLVQIVCDIFVGPIVDRIGYDVPLFLGYIIIIASSLAFAYGDGYPVLFTARAFQGLGSAFVTTSGLALVADTFRDDDERGKMIGIVLCGLYIGLTAGPPFGALLYGIGDRPAPFLAIAAIVVVIAALQLLIRVPRIHKKQHSEATTGSHFRLLKDPYIALDAVIISLGNILPAFVEGILPLHMIKTMCAKPWMLGVVFLPLNGGLAVGTLVFVWLGNRIGRWVLLFVSILFAAAAGVSYPFCQDLGELIVPGIFLGLSAAALNSVAFTMMGYIVDTRIKNTVYGAAYALTDVAYGMSFGIGPIIASFMMSVIQFKGSMFVGAGLTLLVLIPAVLLRNALAKESSTDNANTALLSKEKQRNTGNAGADTPDRVN